MLAIPDSLASMPMPLPFDQNLQDDKVGSMNESFAKNDHFVQRNMTGEKPKHVELYNKYDIPVIPHSKIKILATERNLDTWM